MRKFHSSEYLNALASGEICLVVGWSGDIKQAQKRAAEAKNGVEIGYAIPKDGAQMWFDNFAIPKDAKNVAEAHAFIDYLLRPEVAAKNSNFLAYANGNLASQQLIDKAVLDDRTIYPDEATMETPLHHHRARPENAAADEPAVDQDQDRAVAYRFEAHGWHGRMTWTVRSSAHRQRRCSHSHCSGCSRTQPSTTSVMICMVPCDVDLAVGVARRLDRLGQLDWKRSPGWRTTRSAVDRAFDLAGEPRDQRIGRGAAAEERHRRRPARSTDRPACATCEPRSQRVARA